MPDKNPYIMLAPPKVADLVGKHPGQWHWKNDLDIQCHHNFPDFGTFELNRHNEVVRKIPIKLTSLPLVLT